MVISIALSLQQDGITEDFPSNARAFRGKSPTISEDGDERIKRQAWFERMHQAAPHDDWLQIEYQTRIERHRKRTTAIGYREACGNMSIGEGLVTGRWRERGSSNQAGSVHDVAYDPIADEIWLISAGGTLWRGTRDGSNWRVVNQDLQFNPGLLKFIPQPNGRRLLAFCGRIPHYSDDDGLTWTPASGIRYTDRWGYFHQPTVLNDQHHTIYVFAKASYYANISLYKSTDQGVRFQKIKTYETSDFNNLAIANPHHSNELLIAFKQNNQYGKFFRLNPETDELISLNQGTELKFGDAPANLIGWYGHDLKRFYVYTQNNNATRVQASDNFGSSWSPKGHLNAQPWEVGLYVSPYDPNSLLMGEVECHRSFDGGSLWSKVNNWWDYYEDVDRFLHADMMHFAEFEDASGQPFLLVSHHGGLSYSEDFLDSRKNISLLGLNTSQYYSVRTDPQDPSFVYAGSQDQGFQISSSFQATEISTFEQVISGDYGHIVFSNQGQSVWTVYPGGDVTYYENAQAADWTASFDLESEDESVWLPPLMETPFASENAIYMAGGNSNGGKGSYLVRLEAHEDKILASQFDYDFKAESAGGILSALATSPLDSNRWYVATTNGRFFYSNDAGQNWAQNINFIVDGHYLYGQTIYASKIAPNIVYLGGSGYSNPPVYQSKDGGASFTAMSEGLPNTLVFDLTANADESLLFAATEAGPYVFVVAEGRWYDLSGQCAPAQTYWSVEFVESINTVRFGTYGRGIWDFQMDATVDVQESNLVTEKMMVFPNPSDGIFNLTWNFTNAPVQITVWDVTGKMVHQARSPNNNQAQLNLTHLARGAYFVRIGNIEKFATAKILLR